MNEGYYKQEAGRNVKQWTEKETVQARVDVDRNLQLQLCDGLEMIADSLPDRVDHRLAQLTLSILGESWRVHASFQEQALYPVLKRRESADKNLMLQIGELEREHAVVSAYGHEVGEQLEALIANEPMNADMLGYMLRAVFEGRRRHLEWERVLLEPLLEVALAPVDRLMIDGWFAAHPWPNFQWQKS